MALLKYLMPRPASNMSDNNMHYRRCDHNAVIKLNQINTL